MCMGPLPESSSKPINDLLASLQTALAARAGLMESEHTSASRLFNGFYEGCSNLVADIYARTLVLYSYAHAAEAGAELMAAAESFYLERMPWVDCVVQKIRLAQEPELRRGRVTFGGAPAGQVREHGVTYALDLLMNQDASFYLDTRNLRIWLMEHASGWQVLNTFAYTGSLGVAALAGGAARVVQVDRSGKFLALARRSAQLNGLDTGKMELRGTDFFSAVAHFKRLGVLFDCVILDPPFFSSTEKGRVDLVGESTRLINKLRPLLRDGGYLIAINNALFLSGVQYMAELEKLCQDGYLAVEALLPVPQDFTGYPETVVSKPPVDPAPFNHPTKIAVLRVKRKA
jgi:23S rRNA (cytosine1962-C5)-methyltransferase